MTGHEQEIQTHAKERLFDRVRRLFKALRPIHRAVFSPAGSTSAGAPSGNFHALRAARGTHERT